MWGCVFCDCVWFFCLFGLFVCLFVCFLFFFVVVSILMRTIIDCISVAHVICLACVFSFIFPFSSHTHTVIKRYVHGIYSVHYKATIGVDFALKVINWDENSVVRLQLWDIAGFFLFFFSIPFFSFSFSLFSFLFSFFLLLSHSPLPQ